MESDTHPAIACEKQSTSDVEIPDALPSTKSLETVSPEDMQPDDASDTDQSLSTATGDRYKIEVTPVLARPRGYPQLAAYVGCDPNFALYRQFKDLRHRCLLDMQAELVALESDLEDMDAQDNHSHHRLLICRWRNVCENPPRRMELIAQIKDKISKYDEMLRSTKDLIHWPLPTERNRRCNVNFIEDERPTVETREYLHQPQRRPDHSGSGYQYRFDKSRMNTFIRFVMTAVVAVLLVAPAFTFDTMHPAGYDGDTLILLCTGIFALLVALFTAAKRGELFAATVAYVLTSSTKIDRLDPKVDANEILRYYAALMLSLSNYSHGAHAK
ncbi:hypothetical protein MMC18_001574 [Xylographa bjoerkii]|nr:hypothetical protein [Xylographa bjoerkii]